MSDGDDLGEALRLALTESLQKEKQQREQAEARCRELEAELAASKRRIEELSPSTIHVTSVAPGPALQASYLPPRSANPPPPMPSTPPTFAGGAPAAVDAPSEDAELRRALEETVAEIKNLRELLVRARVDLSELQADEVALAKKRAKVLDDACKLLAEAVGEGQAPPPIPNAAATGTAQMAKFTLGPKRRGSMTIDISEVAELLESLRPPAPPKLE